MCYYIIKKEKKIVVNKMTEEKATYIRIRISKEIKEQFQQLTKEKAINQSELIRQLIINWINRQQK